METASDPAKVEVSVLFRADRLPPTDRSFHRVADCPRVVAAQTEADENGPIRELASMPLEDAAGLDASELEEGHGWGTLGPCGQCWPKQFFDAVYESQQYEDWLDRGRGRAVSPGLVVQAARQHLPVAS
jgi:hypothetical protein